MAACCYCRSDAVTHKINSVFIVKSTHTHETRQTTSPTRIHKKYRKIVCVRCMSFFFFLCSLKSPTTSVLLAFSLAHIYMQNITKCWMFGGPHLIWHFYLLPRLVIVWKGNLMLKTFHVWHNNIKICRHTFQSTTRVLCSHIARENRKSSVHFRIVCIVPQNI